MVEKGGTYTVCKERQAFGRWINSFIQKPNHQLCHLGCGKPSWPKHSTNVLIFFFIFFITKVNQKLDGDEAIRVIICKPLVKQHLVWMDEECYTLRTRVNRLLAIERFVGFIDESVDCTKRFAISSDGHWQNKMKYLKEWITPQLGMMRRYADEETRTRNSRTVYESEGRWAAYAF
jgi:hypothetical protein